MCLCVGWNEKPNPEYSSRKSDRRLRRQMVTIWYRFFNSPRKIKQSAVIVKFVYVFLRAQNNLRSYCPITIVWPAACSWFTLFCMISAFEQWKIRLHAVWRSEIVMRKNWIPVRKSSLWLYRQTPYPAVPRCKEQKDRSVATDRVFSSEKSNLILHYSFKTGH